MRLFKGLAAAFSTYSAIPMPRIEWDGDTPGLALCCFPAVGIACGGALWGWYALCRALQTGGVLFAAAGVCLPLLQTGGIHMDGYMDTVDAISSHQSRERKLEILKDPHCGAFAVIYCGVALLLGFGLLHALYGAALVPVLCPACVLSRALSAICALTLPNARGAGMLFSYTEKVRRGRALAVLYIVAALSCTGMVLIAPLPGAGGAALSLAAVFVYRALALRLFGGVTGDTAGFFLQLCESAALLGVWIGGLL